MRKRSQVRPSCLRVPRRHSPTRRIFDAETRSTTSTSRHWRTAPRGPRRRCLPECPDATPQRLSRRVVPVVSSGSSRVSSATRRLCVETHAFAALSQAGHYVTYSDVKNGFSGTSRRSAFRRPLVTGHRLIQSLTFASRILSGSAPDCSTTSLKSRRSNFSPSACWAFRRSSLIFSSPILYASACPGDEM